MDKSGVIDKALEMLAGDMDELEGKSAMAHSLDDCPDPLTCGEHDGEVGEAMAGEGKPALEIKIGMPTMEGKAADDHPDSDEEPHHAGDLSDDEAEELAKLLK